PAPLPDGPGSVGRGVFSIFLYGFRRKFLGTEGDGTSDESRNHGLPFLSSGTCHKIAEKFLFFCALSHGSSGPRAAYSDFYFVEPFYFSRTGGFSGDSAGEKMI